MAPRVPGLSRLAVSNPRIGLHSLSRTSCGRLVLRTASTTSSSQPPPSNPRVLEQPTRFNPPSHGSRLPRSGGGRSADQGAAVPPPKHYGPALSAAEKEALDSREYPGLPPPPGSWASWFINSRWIHLCLTLVSLARHIARCTSLHIF